MSKTGPILRIFEVRTKAGCADKLLANFETTSADVVRGHAGNLGYFFGSSVERREDTVMFVSVWQNLDAVKTRFGEDWQKSYLPDGYENLIEECSIRHLDVGAGWHIDGVEKD